MQASTVDLNNRGINNSWNCDENVIIGMRWFMNTRIWLDAATQRTIQRLLKTLIQQSELSHREC